jgi:hypothetical protein
MKKQRKATRRNLIPNKEIFLIDEAHHGIRMPRRGGNELEMVVALHNSSHTCSSPCGWIGQSAILGDGPSEAGDNGGA